MGDLAFNEYSWRNSENTVRVSNNIVTESLQKFYDILAMHGHFARSPVFANNELRVNEYCLSSSTNQQYSLKLIDT